MTSAATPTPICEADGLDLCSVFTFLTQRQHAKQPYSILMVGHTPFCVMWDTCCTVRGLMTKARALRFVRDNKKNVLAFEWLEHARVVGGVADGATPAQIVGNIVVLVEYMGRHFPLAFGILENGNTGSAEAMVGNLALTAEQMDGFVDIGRKRTVLRRPPDGLGRMEIAVSFQRHIKQERGMDDQLEAQLVQYEQALQAAEREMTSEQKQERRRAARARSQREIGAESGDAAILRCRTDKVTVMPGEVKMMDVDMRDFHGESRTDTAFLHDDELKCMVAHVALDEQSCIRETDQLGRCLVPIRNGGELPLQFDSGDAVCAVRMVDNTQMIEIGQAAAEAVASLSAVDRGRYEFAMASSTPNGVNEAQAYAAWQLREDAAEAFLFRGDDEDDDDDNGQGGKNNEQKRNGGDESAAHDGSEFDVPIDVPTAPRRKAQHYGRLTYKAVGTWADLMENMTKPKYIFGKLDPAIFDRPDVIPSGVLYAGIGGVSHGSVARVGKTWVVPAYAIEADSAVAQVHQWNNPNVPMVVHRMTRTADVLRIIEEYLPRKHWGKAWVHASNSCKLAAHANMLGRDVEQARRDTVWAIQLLNQLTPAVWTLENVPSLYPHFRGKFPTAYVFQCNKYCDTGQDRKRLILSNRTLFLEKRSEPPRTVRDVLGSRKGWKAGEFLLQRNGWGGVKSVDTPGYTVTSGYMQAGAPFVGEFDERHILDAGDRALLQGFKEPLQFPPQVTETKRREMVAQCVIPGFARVLSEAAAKYQLAVLKADQAMSAIDDIVNSSDAKVMRRLEVDAVHESLHVQGSTEDTAEVPSSWVEELGHHGTWVDYGEHLGWASLAVEPAVHRRLIERMPWLRCDRPPDVTESKREFRTRRVAEKLELHERMAEQDGMADEDVDVGGSLRGAERRRMRGTQAERQFRNVHPRPDELARWDSNAELQKEQPNWYGPYLDEGQKYHTERTDENVEKVCKQMKLDELPDELKGERDYYKQLVYDYWILFDGLLRGIKGVEIDVDLSKVKPKRVAPYRWSPAKVEAGKKIIEGFVRDGIMGPISSEWAWPALLVPKPKGGWRFVVDLRELNKLIPHDTYEPPSCDACLEWLAGKPYRSTFDLLHGFHGVMLSPETQKIFTVVTPFGTYCYKRLVMGYINATAEFQRHTNATFGELLWKSVLSMVDDVCVGSETLEDHRRDMRQALDRMARRHHSVKPEKAAILQKILEYLGHMSTPNGTRPTAKHIQAIVDMPAPIDEETGLINKTSLRSFIGLVKYVRRYIPDCGRLCDPLNQQLTDDADGVWTAVADMVFGRLKFEIAFTKGTWHVDYKHPVFICTDGSKRGIGGYMFQRIDGEERVIGYFSRATRKEERKWDTRELEVLALIATLENFHHYIDGVRVHLQTDHKNVLWLSSMKKLSGRLGRWVLRLSEYDAVISYRKGRYMFVADCLSRNSRVELDEDESVTERPPRGLDVPDSMMPPESSRRPLADEAEMYDAKGKHKVTGLTRFDQEQVDAKIKRSADAAAAAVATVADEYEVYEADETRVSALLTDLTDPEALGECFFMLEFAVSTGTDRTSDAERRMEADLNAPAEAAVMEQATAVTSHHKVGKTGAIASVGGRRDCEVFEVTAGQHAVDLPDTMLPEPVTQEHIRKAQERDDFAIQMKRRCQRALPSDVRARHFFVNDGILYRRHSAADPHEHADALRFYVPPELRARVMWNHHATIFAGHNNATTTLKEMTPLYYWATMERDVTKMISTCEVCQLAKGTRPARHGFLQGWKHNKVLHQICMDLVGPFGGSTGHSKHPTPVYIFVITDPFSHMVWLETIYGKDKEEVFEKFTYRFLCEEGCPRVVLTDNGGEFDNKLLRELMRMCRIRLKFTPAYHPRGNYTERVNRYIGETLRTMVNSPGGLKADWFKMIKFIQLCYRRMPIPGTNLSPSMVARGRQPCVPTELPLLDDGLAVTSGPTLDEHVKDVEKHLKLAEQLLKEARDKVLAKSREQFNQKQIEVVYEPGELVRYYNYVPIRRQVDEPELPADVLVASKLKLRNKKYVVVSRKGTIYVLRNTDTGKERRAHVSQIARMRSEQTTAPIQLPTVDATNEADVFNQVRLFERLSVAKFAVIHRSEDPVSVLRVVEVIHVDTEGEEFGGWYWIHNKVARHYDAERPMKQMTLSPEYSKGGQSGFVNIAAKDRHRYAKVTEVFGNDNVELVATGFNMESGGKVPTPICKKCDLWLRRAARQDQRALVALSEPTEPEQRKIAQLRR